MRSIKSVYSVSYTLSLSIKYQSFFICLQDHREVTKKTKFQSFIISNNHYVVPPPPQKSNILKSFKYMLYYFVITWDIFFILFCSFALIYYCIPKIWHYISIHFFLVIFFQIRIIKHSLELFITSKLILQVFKTCCVMWFMTA